MEHENFYEDHLNNIEKIKKGKFYIYDKHDLNLISRYTKVDKKKIIKIIHLFEK